MSEEAAPRAHVRTPETDEVLRRIGRNVVNFQQVEYLLKYLNTHSAFRGPASEFSARFEKHAAIVQKKKLHAVKSSRRGHYLLPTSGEKC